ncbi:MAG TPA: glutaredoxin family protein [Candidatus Methylomirabilis sp.]|nr:glutaredoxin family protein [Candidatus Methylomirabilis sp.]
MSYQEHIEKVAGKKTKDILFFSLSTCMWCEKATELLNELGLAYDHVVVDMLENEADQQQVYDEIGKYTKDIGFPVLLIDGGKKVIFGYNEAEIRELAK